jgi:hypothetical protein
MRFLIRIVAVLIMLLALGEMAVTLIRFDWASRSSPQGDAEPGKSEVLRQLQDLSGRLQGPGVLFCYAAVVFVLVRISVVQEQDAGPASLPPPPSPHS